MPGRDLDQLEAAVGQAEHAALGDVEHLLAAPARHAAAEGAVLDLRARTCASCLRSRSRSLPSSTATCRSPAVKVPTKTTFLAFWLMLMKPPAPASRGPNLLTLRLPSRVGLRQAEERDVEPAAVVEVELVGLVDDRLGVDRRAEVEAAGRNAADHAGLGGQRQQVDDPLLGGDVGDAFGHADAEVDDAVAPSARARRGAR